LKSRWICRCCWLWCTAPRTSARSSLERPCRFAKRDAALMEAASLLRSSWMEEKKLKHHVKTVPTRKMLDRFTKDARTISPRLRGSTWPPVVRAQLAHQKPKAYLAATEACRSTCSYDTMRLSSATAAHAQAVKWKQRAVESSTTTPCVHLSKAGLSYSFICKSCAALRKRRARTTCSTRRKRRNRKNLKERPSRTSAVVRPSSETSSSSSSPPSATPRRQGSHAKKSSANLPLA